MKLRPLGRGFLHRRDARGRSAARVGTSRVPSPVRPERRDTPELAGLGGRGVRVTGASNSTDHPQSCTDLACDNSPRQSMNHQGVSEIFFEDS